MRRKRNVLILCGILAALSCLPGRASALSAAAGWNGEGDGLPALYFSVPAAGETSRTELELSNSRTEACAVYLNAQEENTPFLLLSVWKDGGLICRRQPVRRLFLGVLRPGERVRFTFAAEAEESLPMGGTEKLWAAGRTEPAAPGALWTLETEAFPTAQPPTGAILPEERALHGMVFLVTLLCLISGVLRVPKRSISKDKGAR